MDSGHKRSSRNFENVLNDLAESVKTSRTYRKQSTQTAFPSLFRRAALVTDFAVDELGVEDVAAKDADALMDLSAPTVQEDRVRWVMPDDLRRRVLDQIQSEGNLRDELNAIPVRPKNPQQAAFEQIVNDSFSLEGRDEIEPLAAFQVAASWFSKSPSSITEEAIKGRIRWLNLIKPFRDLVNGNFQGRADELDELSDYVGALDASGFLEFSRRALRSIFSIREEPPLMIHGPGGIGKSTLLAQFILMHAGVVESGRLPFVYIDFDRSRISPERPLSLLFDALDQMEAQYPEHAKHFGGLRESWSRGLAEAQKRISGFRYTTSNAGDSTFDFRARAVSEFAKALEAIDIKDRPFLLFLDTFERVRFSSDHTRTEFWSLLDHFQEQHPYLRIVVSGRAPVGAEPDVEPGEKQAFDLRTRKLELKGLSKKAAIACLEGAEVDPADAKTIAERITPEKFGVSPLSLRVAAAVWHRRRKDGEVDIVDDDFWADLQAGRIQDQLIERYLNNLTDGDLQRLVNPGFVLRRINKTLIREVLAEPCGVDIMNDGEAEVLFDQLRKAIDLVASTDDVDDDVVPRTEVRQVILSLMEELEQEKVSQIHANARSWYEKVSDDAIESGQSRLGARMRAEELYHRLMLGGEESVVKQRWLESAAEYLTDVDDEMKPAGLALLKTLRHEHVSEQLNQAASQATWEAAIENQIKHEKDAGKRLALATQRKERSPGSRIYALHAIALRDLQRTQEALEVVRNGLASFTPEASSAERCDLLLLGAELCLEVSDSDKAREMLAAARTIADRREDPQRLLRVGLEMLDTVQADSDAETNERTEREADEVMRQALAMQDRRALRNNLNLIVRVIARAGYRLPEAVMAGIRAGVLEQLEQSDLRDLARKMAAYDRSNSARQGQPTGHVALEVGIPFQGNANQAWQSFFTNLLTLAPTVLEQAFARFGLAEAEPFLHRVCDAVSRSLAESPQLERIVDSSSAGNWWPWRRVSGKRLSAIAAALDSALDLDQLRELLDVGLDIRLETFLASSRKGSTESMYRVVSQAYDQGWLDGLMMLARFARPRSGRLLEVSSRLGTGTLIFDKKALERLSRVHTGLALDAKMLAAADPRVCRVMIDGATRGTGFLVGPDRIVSTYHVLEPLLEVPESSVVFNFDLAVSRNGSELDAGTSYRPAGGQAPVVASDDPESGVVLIATEGFPGDDPVGGKIYRTIQQTRRGWVDMQRRHLEDDQHHGLVLLHYPEGRRLTAEIEVQSPTIADGQLTYVANTAPGSSGAPIFDGNMRLIGVHQGRHNKQSWGTSIDFILERFAELDVLESIGHDLE